MSSLGMGVKIPSIIKLRNGEYTSLSLNLDIDQTIALRASIIQHTAEVFQPHFLLVDKEPLGLRGEVRETLEKLKRQGIHLVLGLRDSMLTIFLETPDGQDDQAGCRCLRHDRQCQDQDPGPGVVASGGRT